MVRTGKRGTRAPKRQSAKILNFDQASMSKANIQLYLQAFSSVRGRMRGTSLTVTGRNDYELWSRTLFSILSSMGYEDTSIIVGFLADLINSQHEQIRHAIAQAVIKGLGLQIIEHDGWVCENCGASARKTLEDGKTPPDFFPHYDVLVADDGHVTALPQGVDIPEELKDQLIPCAGKPEKTKVFERLMEPTYPPLVTEEQRAQAQAAMEGKPGSESGLWLPG